MSAVNTNHVTLTGNLVRAPELRYTASQTPVCSFTLAVNRMPSKYGGQECDFIPVVVWGKAGESCDRYLSKGRKV
ncbi:MAG: single-stranded DNA-binding protein, partial [Pyramidobacter sp.]|nr:single-stranded DNA-binding protein [Pyramidobacter sp.]